MVRDRLIRPLSPQPLRRRTRLPPAVSGGLKKVLRLLHDAAISAADLGCDPWQFAVEWTTCHDRKVSPCDLRRLNRAGLVDHKVETGRAGATVSR
jgi:hypothetical protein